jgi:hypothetical protein
MIELTEEQRRQLTENATPRVLDPATRKVYVLVDEDLFQRLQAVLGNGTVYTTAEMLDRVMADDDGDDPYLAELQQGA